MDDTPNLSPMYVNPALFGGATEALIVHGSNAGVYYRWVLTTNNGSVLPPVQLTTAGGATMTGHFSPTVIPWPSRGAADHASIGTSCGVFIDQATQPRFYCYVKSTDRWQDFTAQMYAKEPMRNTVQKVSLAYHVSRESTGAALISDSANGQFWMTVVPIPGDADGDGVTDRGRPVLYISRQLTSTQLPSATTLKWMYSGNYWDAMQTVEMGTNVTLYEDESISAMKGAWLNNTQQLFFFPFADGTSPEILKDGNDYQVMERGICMGVHGGIWNGAQSVCGTSNKFGY
jgi:hypothetical protein